MKKIVYILIVVLAIIGCKGKPESSFGEPVSKSLITSNQTTESRKDTAKHNLGEPKSTSLQEPIGQKVSDIDSLKRAGKNSEIRLEKLEDKTDSLDKKYDDKLGMAFLWFSLLLFAILFVMVLMILWRIRKIKGRVDENKGGSPNKSQELCDNYARKEIESLKSRIKQMSSLPVVQPEKVNTSAREEVNPQGKPVKASSKFYLGNFSRGIFQKDYPYYCEDALFEAEEKGGGLYAIRPLNLDTLRTIESSLNDVVEKTGCQLSEAVIMDCTGEGLVRYKEEIPGQSGYWKVEKKVKINLTK